MAFLQADSIRQEWGLTIHEKIIPWGAVWPKNVYNASGRLQYAKGSRYKADRLLSGGSGKVQYITIHNTNTIVTARGTTMAEQYARATWPNANMKDSRVHYYIDDTDCWQLLREDEVGWHATDSRGPGEERGALLAAILLTRHGLPIERLVTHQRGYAKKYCPQYILPHWETFRQRVTQYMQEAGKDSLKNETADVREETAISVGDLVRLKETAVYTTGAAIPAWVRAKNWYVKSISGTRVVIDRDEQGTHSICSPVHKKDLILVRASKSL